MRIGLETLSCDGRTGIGRIVRALATAFTARGHEVHVLARDPGRSDDRVHLHRARGFAPSKAISKLLFRAGEEHRLGRLRCDVVYSFGVGREADVVAAQSCHRAGMEILRPYSLGKWEPYSLGLYDRVSLWDEKALLTSPKTKRIIACSALVKRQIVECYKLDPDRITVIPNGITPRVDQRRDPRTGERRKILGITREEIVLLFMGNEFTRKGLHGVLGAMARLGMPDVHLIVAGGGDARPFERYAETLGLTGRVTFVGRVEDPEQWFDIADLFVFPTLYEPFGMVVLEAMAAGVPVITSRNCGATEGMTHGLHGMFLNDPTSADEVAQGIRALLEDEGLRSKVSAAGRDIAHQFCWDTIADRTIDVLVRARTERLGQ